MRVPTFFSQVAKQLTIAHLISHLLIVGLLSGMFRLVAWLAQLELVSERAYWAIIPPLILVFSIALATMLAPYFRPRCRLVIEWLGFGTNKDGHTIGYCVIVARNTGMPSTMDGWTFYVTPPNGKEMKGDRLSLHQPANLTHKGYKQTFVPEDWIVNKGAESPVPRGGRITGVLIARFSGVQEADLSKPGTHIRITCADCFGEIHQGEFTWEKAYTGELLTFSNMKSPPPEKVVPPMPPPQGNA
jgi:hypothetical protein